MSQWESDRALAPVVGVPLLVLVTVVLASVAAAGVVGGPGEASAPTVASFDAEADATGEIRVVHRGGDAVDPEALDLHVRVDGEPLAAQPPVPFFAARGFESGPTGAFNHATQGPWRAGEAATLRVAGTNEPALTAGATVELRLSVDGHRVATLEARVQAASRGPPSAAVDSSPWPPPPSSSSGT